MGFTKIIYLTDESELAQFAIKPEGFDFTGYGPIRAYCPFCSSYNSVGRELVEKYKEYSCENCKMTVSVPYVCPDPGLICTLGFRHVVFYFN